MSKKAKITWDDMLKNIENMITELENFQNFKLPKK